MKKEKRLLLARNIFAFIVFVTLGVIVVTEKGKEILIPKAEKNMTEYLSTTYPDLKEETTQSEVTFENGTYTMKVSSKENNKLYFYVNQKRQKIKDTYKEDYLEGKTLFTSLQKELEKEIKEKTKTAPTVEIISTLDQYTEAVKERILKEDHLLELPFYKLKKELLINEWNAKDITKKITELITFYEEKSITPKSYTITITNQENITESIEIKNISSSFIEESSKEEVIQDILDDNHSKLLKENKITYKYLNEEE